MKLKQSPEITLQIFENLKADHGGNLSRDDILQFVNVSRSIVSVRKNVTEVHLSNPTQSNFEHRGVEFTEWIPNDWGSIPQFLLNIRDPEYRKFGSELNALWKKLGRKMIDDVSVSS